MANLPEALRAEFERIESAVADLASIDDVLALSPLELAGAGAILQGLYNGCENVLKRILLARGVKVPSGPSWHQDLLRKAGDLAVVSEDLRLRLQQYAAFRHFFSHSYGTHLDPARIAPLIAGAPAVMEAFKSEVTGAVERE